MSELRAEKSVVKSKSMTSQAEESHSSFESEDTHDL